MFFSVFCIELFKWKVFFFFFPKKVRKKRRIDFQRGFYLAKRELKRERERERERDLFGNCFFSLFSVFKNNFLFLKLKNLFGISK